MNKTAIKNYAVWARKDLIDRVKRKAYEYEVTDSNLLDGTLDIVHGKPLNKDEKKQRQDLIHDVKEKGFDHVMEEVAYTWFNRFIALRFMEVNNYLPKRIRIFTNENNEFKPQIIDEAMNIELEGLDKNEVYELLQSNNQSELYEKLLIAICNDMGNYLPGMFKKINDYRVLLFPDNLLNPGSVLDRLISDIEEDSFNVQKEGQVEIIGWFYQFYNTDLKAKVFAKPKGTKIKKEEIAAATQLFTPDWIVRYMVENSLGRLWIEGHKNDILKSNWKYYLDDAKQEEKVERKLQIIRDEYKNITPESIKLIDPCMGSGHILVYAFDVLIQIYESYGYSQRDAAKLIVKNNIFGLDIDKRAAQLTYFAIMMKGRQYDRRFLTRDIKPHVYDIPDIDIVDKNIIDKFGDCSDIARRVCDSFIDGKEFGSLISPKVSLDELDKLEIKLDQIQLEDTDIFAQIALNIVEPLIDVVRILVQKYDISVTNPPYMAVSSAGIKLNEYIKKHYPSSKTDLFAVFIERCNEFIKKNRFQAMITMHSWMFLSSYTKLRENILNHEDIVSMIHLGARAFDGIGGEVVQTTSFVFKKTKINEIGSFIRLVHGYSELEKRDEFFNSNNLYYANGSLFSRIPSSPIIYWINQSILNLFDKGKIINDIADPRQGLATADNERFIRFWWEVNFNKIGFGFKNRESAAETNFKFFPYNKGGELRRWYGSNFYVVDWYKDGKNIKEDKLYKLSIGKCLESNSKPKNMQYYFRKGITWSLISTSRFGVRCFPEGMIFDVGSHCVFTDDKRFNYLAAYLNSDLAEMILNMLNPTMNFSSGIIGKLPVLDISNVPQIDDLVERCISIAKKDWDENEYSWDFRKSPLVGNNNGNLKEIYKNYIYNCKNEEKKLNEYEISLNKIIEQMYEVDHKSIVGALPKKEMIHQKDVKRDITDLISYSVGCMFGRYSLDVEGLAYAGGEWDSSKYKTFIPDVDNIIPVNDDEYFEDDIVGRFIDFVKVVYGEDTLEENLEFIASALGGKGTSREIIRNYFLNEFYKDHCKIYQKRPIYWMFDSGKKNGFKALIYMHRYSSDLIARLRTQYVFEQQSRYRNQIEMLQSQLNGELSSSERVKLNKKLKTLREQDEELRGYEEKVHHYADLNREKLKIDLDDGVKVNYEKFKELLAKIK